MELSTLLLVSRALLKPLSPLGYPTLQLLPLGAPFKGALFRLAAEEGEEEEEEDVEVAVEF